MRSRSMTPFSYGQAINEPLSRLPGQVLAANPPAAEQGGILKLINGLKTDDYILIGIIAVLFFEGCDDYMLLAALGYLFLMGIL